MAEYIVTSDDQASESLLVAYRNERVDTQTVVGRVHNAIVQALAAEVRFNELIAEGGQLAPLADLDALRALMMQVVQTMEGLEEAVPGLFPGVTVQDKQG